MKRKKTEKCISCGKRFSFHTLSFSGSVAPEKPVCPGCRKKNWEHLLADEEQHVAEKESDSKMELSVPVEFIIADPTKKN